MHIHLNAADIFFWVVVIIVAICVYKHFKSEDKYYDMVRQIQCKHEHIENNICQDCNLDMHSDISRICCPHEHTHREQEWRGYDDQYDYEVCDKCGYTRFLS